jgi:hypothetical protein
VSPRKAIIDTKENITMPAYPSEHYATPATYITFDKGKYWLVHYGEPISCGKDSIAGIMAWAETLSLEVAVKVWCKAHAT